jgi:RHS repeat-associated protein
VRIARSYAYDATPIAMMHSSACSSSVASENRYKFTAKERDSESGLDNFGARYYSSSVGRFMSVDPSSVSIDKFNPQSWNRYNYTYNNPLKYVDQNGKWPKPTHELIIDRAFPGLSVQQTNELKQVSAWVDRIPGGQTKAHNHEHAMKSPGENPATARQAIDQNIANHEQAARQAQGGTPEHANQITPGALNEFGLALHPVTDRASPAHTDQNGNPRDWAGLPVTPGEVEAVQQHEAEEANITPEQMNTATQAARDAFKQVFGDAALQEAIQEPKKKEEPKKKDE